MPNQRTHRRRRRRKNGADPTPPRGPLDDITEDLACLVFTHVDYLRDRRSLSAVSKILPSSGLGLAKAADNGRREPLVRRAEDSRRGLRRTRPAAPSEGARDDDVVLPLPEIGAVHGAQRGPIAGIQPELPHRVRAVSAAARAHRRAAVRALVRVAIAAADPSAAVELAAVAVAVAVAVRLRRGGFVSVRRREVRGVPGARRGTRALRIAAVHAVRRRHQTGGSSPGVVAAAAAVVAKLLRRTREVREGRRERPRAEVRVLQRVRGAQSLVRVEREEFLQEV
eukprot:30854-Pelagococcus_subviridis.AAC.11